MQQFRCEKQQLAVHFLLFQHLLLLGSQKEVTFFLSTAIKPNGDKGSGSTGQFLVLLMRCLC